MLYNLTSDVMIDEVLARSKLVRIGLKINTQAYCIVQSAAH